MKEINVIDMIIKQLPFAILIINQDGDVSSYNKKAEELYSHEHRYDFRILEKINVEELINQEYAKALVQKLNWMIQYNKSKVNVVLDTVNYSRVYKTSIIHLRQENAEVNNDEMFLVSIHKDHFFDELEAVIKELDDIRYALEESSIVAITDAFGAITYVNDKFCEISQYEREELIGKDHNIVNSSHHSKQFFRTLWQTIRKGKVWRGEIKNKTKQGNYYWVDTTIVPFVGADGKVTQFVSIRNDITDRKIAEEKIRYIAYHDDLTQLPNRRYLLKYLDKKIKRRLESKKPFFVFLMDLDRFKILNDSFGHRAGDRLLIKISERLLKLSNEIDILARYGGDEFVILAEIESKEQAMEFAQKCLREIRKPVVVNGQPYYITASLGISQFPADGLEEEELIKRAEMSMYFMKENSNNDAQFYNEHIKGSMDRKISIEKNLRQALETEGLYLVYQPKVNSKTKQIYGVEALTRWHSKELGFVSPGEFIPVAEETGLVYQLDSWVLENACKQAKEWQKKGYPPITIAVNISVAHFEKNELVQVVNNILEKYELDPAYLEIEITENLSLNEIKYVHNILLDLKNLGVQISIDDFGTGYSSFGYLRKFQIDHLKIDQSFVQRFNISEDEIILQAIIQLAKNLGINVIAEGVEEKEQLYFLKKHGCYNIQGYLFSKPEKAESIEKEIFNKNSNLYLKINEICV